MSGFTAIIQVRRGSSRFRDKVLKKIMYKPLLYHEIRRLQRSRLVSSIVVATTEQSEDKVLKKICDLTNVNIFYGNTHDVLDRYYNAARNFNLENIVRITADCPVIDPKIIDEAISKFIKEGVDYLNNCSIRTFPEGMSVEVFRFETLEKAWKESLWSSEREHVTPYIWKNADKFSQAVLLNPNGNQSDIRLTIDYPKDLILIRKIYRSLFPMNPYFGLDDIIELINQFPDLKDINNDIIKYEGYTKSLREDTIVKTKR
ncbi:MAG: glycosyltransferase family protein [Candidatus Nitrosocosmicus sp.]|nr:glycosyltransferase family protein [Candidatus Nitrosocosmicus sp.]